MTEKFERKLKVVPVRFGVRGPVVGEATVETQADGHVMATVTITDPAYNKSLLEALSLNVGGFSIWKERD